MRTRRVGIQRRQAMKMMAFGLLLSAGLHAGEAPERGRQQNSHSRTKQAVRNLRIGPGMAVSDRFALRAAYVAALRKIEKVASCRALFNELRLDGLDALSRNHYQPAQSAAEQALCSGGVVAATGVGLGQVLICERFRSLPRNSKVAVLIHETLHTAGLNEVPYDPEGMTSREITRMVKEACSL